METPPTAAVAVNKPAPPTAPVQNPTSAPAASSARQQPEIHGNDAGEQKATMPPAVGAPAVSGSISGVGSASEAGPVTDLEKKLRRAERFGMRVMLSDEEKRNSRAERFGTGSTPNGSKNVGQLEEQKRKARAERFGLKSLTVDDEEAKKKARLERFAPKSKLDTAEEEKRKARAIRFSQALPKVSGQDNSDLKATAVAQT